jgi:hypothetical protein
MRRWDESICVMSREKPAPEGRSSIQLNPSTEFFNQVCMPGQLFLPLSLQFWTIMLPQDRSSIQLNPNTEFFNQFCMPA